MVEHFKIQEAKNKLIKRILDVDTLNCTGSMSYVLWQLNCQDDLLQIFKILATQSLETKFHAYNILSEQEFIFTKEDIHEIINIWNKVKENPKSHEIYDDETFEMIKDAYEGFVEYLKE